MQCFPSVYSFEGGRRTDGEADCSIYFVTLLLGICGLQANHISPLAHLI